MSLGLPYAMFSDTPTAKAMKKVNDDLQEVENMTLLQVKAMGQVPLEFDRTAGCTAMVMIFLLL